MQLENRSFYGQNRPRLFNRNYGIADRRFAASRVRTPLAVACWLLGASVADVTAAEAAAVAVVLFSSAAYLVRREILTFWPQKYKMKEIRPKNKKNNRYEAFKLWLLISESCLI